MGQTGFCEKLRFSAVCCENLRFPAILCEDQRFRSAVTPRKTENPVKISEALRKTANLAPFVPFSLSLCFPLSSYPGFHLRLEASDCSWALGHLLGSAARRDPTTRAKTGRTAHVFTAQGGTRRVSQRWMKQFESENSPGNEAMHKVVTLKPWYFSKGTSLSGVSS